MCIAVVAVTTAQPPATVVAPLPDATRSAFSCGTKSLSASVLAASDRIGDGGTCIDHECRSPLVHPLRVIPEPRRTRQSNQAEKAFFHESSVNLDGNLATRAGGNLPGCGEEPAGLAAKNGPASASPRSPEDNSNTLKWAVVGFSLLPVFLLGWL